jgi:hypothetical protein
MLFIKLFSTFIFTSLVFGFTVLAMPTNGIKPDNIEKKKVHKVHPKDTEHPARHHRVCVLSVIPENRDKNVNPVLQKNKKAVNTLGHIVKTSKGMVGM